MRLRLQLETLNKKITDYDSYTLLSLFLNVVYRVGEGCDNLPLFHERLYPFYQIALS